MSPSKATININVITLIDDLPVYSRDDAPSVPILTQGSEKFMRWERDVQNVNVSRCAVCFLEQNNLVTINEPLERIELSTCTRPECGDVPKKTPRIPCSNL